MNGRLYWQQRLTYILIQLIGLSGACIYLKALKLGLWQILPLFFVCLAVIFCYNLLRYRKQRAYFRKMAVLVDQLDEKYLFPQIWKDAKSYEETGYLCLLRECTKSMLEQVELSRREGRDYQEWLETYVHDMKQPISAIKLIAERMRTEDSRDILLELETMNHHLEQVLYYGRSESPHTDFIFKKVNFLDVLNECLSMNKQMLIQNRVRIEIPEFFPEVYGDEKGILFLLNQLVYNAAVYRRDQDPVIQFTYSIQMDNLHFFIRDNGCGITAEDLPRVFEKGFTGKNGRKNLCSTGMGLYLCKKHAEDMGIGLSIQSEENIYTEVCMALPLRL